MLEYLFVNKNVEKVLMYLYLHGKAHATELSRAFKSSLDPIQKTLRKLEEGGLLVSFLEGRTRVFQWNPRYPFLREIQALAKKAYEFLPPVAIGAESIRHFETLSTPTGSLRLLTPTDCVKDRLSSFFHWDDKQALEQALLVAKDQPIDLGDIKRWAKVEHHSEKLKKFLKMMSSA